MNTPDYCFLKSVFYSKTFLGGFCRNHGKEPPQHHKICDEQSSVCRKFFLGWVCLTFSLQLPPKINGMQLERGTPFLKKNEEKRYVPPPPLFSAGVFHLFAKAKAWLVFFFVLLDASKSRALGIEICRHRFSHVWCWGWLGSKGVTNNWAHLRLVLFP